MSVSSVRISSLLTRLASPDERLGGLGAGAIACAMGLALFEASLKTPPDHVPAATASQIVDVLAGLRNRVLRLANENAPSPLARYRIARRMLDLAIQALTYLQSALDWGNPAYLTDQEAGWRLVHAAMRTAIAEAEDRLRELDPAIAEAERPSLETQAREGNELAIRAESNLAWRRGKI